MKLQTHYHIIALQEPSNSAQELTAFVNQFAPSATLITSLLENHTAGSILFLHSTLSPYTTGITLLPNQYLAAIQLSLPGVPQFQLASVYAPSSRPQLLDTILQTLLQSPLPQLWIGDFNFAPCAALDTYLIKQPPQWPLLDQLLQEHVLHDIFRNLHPTALEFSRKGKLSSSRIDLALSSSLSLLRSLPNLNLQIQHHISTSDHNPQLLTFSIQPLPSITHTHGPTRRLRRFTASEQNQLLSFLQPLIARTEQHLNTFQQLTIEEITSFTDALLASISKYSDHILHPHPHKPTSLEKRLLAFSPDHTDTKTSHAAFHRLLDAHNKAHQQKLQKNLHHALVSCKQIKQAL
jgi:exonuclease III